MVNVGCCGHTLLNLAIPNGSAILQQVAVELTSRSGPPSKEAALCLWWLTALLHDHTYAISHYLRHLAPRILVIRFQIGNETTPRELELWQEMGSILAQLVFSISGGRLRSLLEGLHQKTFASVSDYRAYISKIVPLVAECTRIKIHNHDVSEQWEICADHGVLAAINLYEITGTKSLLNGDKRRCADRLRQRRNFCTQSLTTSTAISILG